MLIFLDIDGVLVPEKKFDVPISRADLLKFDPDCLSQFEAVLRDHPAVNVAIASSWREVFPFSSVRRLFSPDVAPRVLGFTPFLETQIIHQLQYLRHQEVLEYLRQSHASMHPWVAVDDIPEHYPPDVDIVVTDADVGFDASAALALDLHLTRYE